MQKEIFGFFPTFPLPCHPRSLFTSASLSQFDRRAVGLYDFSCVEVTSTKLMIYGVMGKLRPCFTLLFQFEVTLYSDRGHVIADLY